MNRQQSRVYRRRRVRSTISGTAARPRLTIFRSLKHMAAQLIDDQAKKTLVGVTDREVGKAKMTKTAKAEAVGKLLATKAKDKKINTVVFDRAGYQYHGRVKALAEAARAGGLQF